MKMYFFKTVLLDNFFLEVIGLYWPVIIFIIIGGIWAIYQTNENEKRYKEEYPSLSMTKEESIDLENKMQKIIKEGKERRKRNRENSIINFLNSEASKLPASDIDFRLNLNNIDLTKSTLEKLYKSGRVGRTSNYRYFTKTSKNRKTQPGINTSIKDPEKELLKLKNLLDKGLITKDDYNLKKKQVLGI